jgi:very-long-chain enoyl-CoA reductase
MATQATTLQVLPRGVPIPRLPQELALPRGASASAIYEQIAAKSGISIHRVRVTKGSDGQVIPNDGTVPVHTTGLLDGSKIYVKDLGTLRWRRSCYRCFFG